MNLRAKAKSPWWIAAELRGNVGSMVTTIVVTRYIQRRALGQQTSNPMSDTKWLKTA